MVDHNNSTRRGHAVWKKFGTLVFFLLVLPTVITYFHFQYLLRGNESCFVGPTSSSSSTSSNNDEAYGIYRRNLPSSSKTFSLWKHPSSYGGLLSAFLQCGFPSAATMAKEMTVSTETSGKSVVDYQITLQQDTRQWCLSSSTSTQDQTWCHGIQEMSPYLEPHFPPSGIWTSTNADNNANDNGVSPSNHNIMVSCAGSSMIKNSKNKPTNASFTSSWWPTKLHEHVRKNPNRIRNNKGPKKLMRQLSQQPATTLLIAVNVLLALAYYSNRTSPSSVAKSYADIVQRGQIWRSITGATAHFDIMHIGFNMMALQSLGVELEQNTIKSSDSSGYTSIQFLLYNLSLIPITTIIMMTITHFRIRRNNNHSSNNNNNNNNISFYARNPSDVAEQYSVGYSGVLFSWSVISALERTTTCPVFFVPDLCFTTHKLGFLKFNLSPLVSLLFCQFIMPRVSFVGHLSGIIAGFALHWNLLPLEIISPQVLYGVICILFWHYGNHPISNTCKSSSWIKMAILAAKPSTSNSHGNDEYTSNNNNDDDDDELLDPLRLHTNTFTKDSKSKRKDTACETTKQRRKLLVWIKNLLLVLCVASFILTNVRQSASLFLAQTVTMISFAYMVLFYFQANDDVEDDNWNGRSGGSLNDYNALSATEYCVKIAKGHIVIVVLTLVTDCMAIASWLAGYIYIRVQINIGGGNGPCTMMSHPLSFILFATLRTVINFFAMLLASNVLCDLPGDNFKDNGIFGRSLGWIVHSCDSVANRFLFMSPKTQFIPFEGKGITLRSLS